MDASIQERRGEIQESHVLIAVKSHTAIVTNNSDHVSSSKLVTGLDRSPTVTVRGQLTPKGHLAAFEATGVEMSRPHKFLYDFSDSGLISVGAEVEFIEEPGKTYIVVTPERVHAIQNIASHCSVWLDEVRVTPGGSGS